MEEDQQNEIVKRGPGRPPKVQEQAVSADVVPVMYYPGDGDPYRTEVNGIKFSAGVPTMVPKNKTVLVPIREEYLKDDGSVITRSPEKRISQLELLRKNPCFGVDGAMPVSRKLGVAKIGDSPEWYRGYAIKWITEAASASELDARWDGEEDLRSRCGIQDRDIDNLRPFFEARRLQLSAD